MTRSTDALTRRGFLGIAATLPLLSGYHQLAAVEKKRRRISDVETMVLKGGRTYVLVKVIADDGVYGIAEAYGTPGIGVKEHIHARKPWLIGKDPLEIDLLYTTTGKGSSYLSGTHTDGSAHGFMRAVSGIEMAL